MILSGVIAALASASLMAQVYSLNAVGYINVTIPTGFSIMTDQLYATNQTTPQYISPLLDAQLGSGSYDGVQIYKFNNVSQSYTTFSVDSLSSPPYDGGNAAATTLNPGEAVFVYNPFPPFTLTFVGQVPQGNLTNTLLPGFNLVGSVVPQAGALDTALGLTEIDGDQVYTFDPVKGYTTYSGDSLSSPPWDGGPGGAAPTVIVGQGFFYRAASGRQLWVRSFSVN
jgi:hypothetical protein